MVWFLSGFAPEGDELMPLFRRVCASPLSIYDNLLKMNLLQRFFTSHRFANRVKSRHFDTLKHDKLAQCAF
jgi:hypothetical protein